MARKPGNHKSFDLDFVRAAARGRWPEILAQLGGIDRELLDGDHHPCPRCGGSDRFRMIDADAGALLCNACFRDKNGDGFAALQWLLSIKFATALERVADYLAIDPSVNNKAGRNKKDADPAEHLKFQPWNEGLAEAWCVLHKPGIIPAAMLAAGCKLARYRDQHTVFAFPVWGSKLATAAAVGWCLYDAGGGKLPKYRKDKPTEYVKTKLTYGSQPGLIGPVDQLATAETAWKTEGVTDMLAALSLYILSAGLNSEGPPTPPDGPPTVFLTNANGAGERPAPWMLELFSGKQARVIHDADEPGERGAAGYLDSTGEHRPGWAELVAPQVAECRHVRLPYPLSADHGLDLRSWINEGHCYADLVALAEAATPVAKATATGPLVIESDDDPHRLARVNMDRYATHATGATLRYWRDEWYTWKPARGCYRKINAEELRAKLNASIKKEFDRINIEQQTEVWRDETPMAQKVTKTLVTNVLDATKSLTVVPSSVDMMSWLDGQRRERCNYVAMANGILDLDRLLGDDDAEIHDVLLPHSPCWFSTTCLPYDFDPDAECSKWESYLEKNLEMDPERIKILQEWAGYLLLPDTGQQKFLALEGEGANGKSVYIAAITAMIGLENCSHVSIELLGDKFARTQTVGKLANICPDAGEIDKTKEGDFKSFVSGDVMFFDRKNISGLNCAPTARMMMAFNNRPNFRDRSDGLRRRMILMPFDVQIKITERVQNMDKHWWWEQSGELPGIFLWAVAGLHRLRQQGRFTESEKCNYALDDFRSESNPARAFLVECLEADENSSLRTISIYKIYKSWADAHGYRPLGERSFGKEIRRVFPTAERKFRGPRGDRFWCYDGLRFSQDEICGHRTSMESLF